MTGTKIFRAAQAKKRGEFLLNFLNSLNFLNNDRICSPMEDGKLKCAVYWPEKVRYFLYFGDWLTDNQYLFYTCLTS